MTSSDVECEDKVKGNRLLQLPVARVKTIMRSSPDLGNVSHEGYYMITRATELFVAYMAEQAFKQSQDTKSVNYKSLAEVVREDDSLEFLEEIVPKKIKVSEYWKKIGYNPSSTENDSIKSPVKGSAAKSPSLKSPMKEQQSCETIVID